MSKWPRFAPRENSAPVAARWRANSFVAPAASVRTSTGARPWVSRARSARGDLRQRGVEHGEVIGCGVRAGPPRAQQLGHRLPAAAGAVIDEPEQRMEPEALLPGPTRLLLLRMRVQQGGVQIDHHLPVLDRRPREVRHRLPAPQPARS